MPSPAQILQQLTQLAHDARGVALAWHLATLLALAALVSRRWRPRTPFAAVLGATPLASASALAFASGNPFNGTVLGAVAALLAALGIRLPMTRLAPGPRWAQLTGAAAVAYALLYPHFLPVRGWAGPWFAPTGVVPCPSLALTLGLGLLAGGFGSRAWCLAAAAAGGFYALFGVLRLGVLLDAGLLLAAGALGVLGERLRRSGTAAGPASAAAVARAGPRAR